MNTQDNRHQLKKITETLLSPEVNYNDIRMAVHALKDLFCTAVGFDETETAKQGHIQTSGGQAISTYTAALCITDMMRTRKFLLGIKEAVEERLQTDPGKPIIILYAGAGPFATLLTPLTTVFAPDQLQMVLLEINPVSIAYLQKTIQQFGLEKHIIGIEQADAVHYTIPANYQPDILLSETMKPALQKEPQVSIVANLLPQCKPDTMLIPSTIIVEACLVGNLASDPLAIMPLQTLLELDKNTAMQINTNPVISTGITITIPEKPEPLYKRIVLTTTVNVFGDHHIGLQESGITLTSTMLDIAGIKKYPARLLFRYIMNEEPGFVAEIV
ncbi:MAG: hypothetical protein HOP10_01985 [Chitinophagaceae bacterium]|nr:hypothetical protein [Chitinophagaceae bacterium]